MKLGYILICLLVIGCSVPKQVTDKYTRIPIIITTDPPRLDPIEKDDLRCLDPDIKLQFWMFYRRVGLYMKHVHRAIQEHNRKVIEENKRNEKNKSLNGSRSEMPEV